MKSTEKVEILQCELAVNGENLEQGGCGTWGEIYFKNKLFTGTMVVFDSLQKKLLAVEEYKDGFLHGLSLNWEEENDMVVAEQMWHQESHGETITWLTNEKRVVWERYEYAILLESGFCDPNGNTTSQKAVLSKEKRKKLKHLRETVNAPVPPSLRTVPDEKLYETMPDYDAYFARYQHLRISKEELARRREHEERMEFIAKQMNKPQAIIAVIIGVALVISLLRELMMWYFAK